MDSKILQSQLIRDKLHQYAFEIFGISGWDLILHRVSFRISEDTGTILFSLYYLEDNSLVDDKVMKIIDVEKAIGLWNTKKKQ